MFILAGRPVRAHGFCIHIFGNLGVFDVHMRLGVVVVIRIDTIVF